MWNNIIVPELFIFFYVTCDYMAMTCDHCVTVCNITLNSNPKSKIK